jgi:hypothetical protein
MQVGKSNTFLLDDGKRLLVFILQFFQSVHYVVLLQMDASIREWLLVATLR